MLQEPIEGISLLSADDAFLGNEALKISQSLPVLQFGVAERRTFSAEVPSMARS
jgi:hypothetical protein